MRSLIASLGIRNAWCLVFKKVKFVMKRRCPMKFSNLGYCAACMSILLFGAYVLAAPQAGGYHLLKKIPFGAAPGGSEYFDYINFDSVSRRVYLSHGTEFLVVDADEGAIVGAISGLKRDHGVALVPEVN